MVTVVLKPKPIKINGFEGIMLGAADGTVQWRIAKTMQVVFSSSSVDEQHAMADMHAFIDEYNNRRAAFMKEQEDDT